MVTEETFKALSNTDHIRANLRRSSVKAVVVSGSTGFLEFANRIVSTAILARILAPEHFGLVMIATAVIAIAEQFRDFGLSLSMLHQQHVTHKELSNLFWINLLLSAVVALVVCSVAPAIAVFYSDPRLKLIIWLLALNIIMGGIMVQHQVLLTRQLKMGHTAGVRLFASVASTLIAIFFAWNGANYWALVWREIIRSAMVTIGMWICFPWSPGAPDSSTSVRHFLRFGSHITVANIVGSVAAGADRFALGRISGADSVAIFRQAYQLLLVPLDQLISPLLNVTQPALSMLQSDPVRYRQYYRSVLTAISIASMPLSVFVAIYSVEISGLLLGPKWVGCAPVLAILSLSALIRQPVQSVFIILLTGRRSRMFMSLSLLQDISLAFFVFVGAIWGPIGVALADVAVTFALVPPKLHFALKNSPVSLRMFFSSISRPALASAIMALTLILSRAFYPSASYVLSIVVGASICVVVYPGSLILLMGGTKGVANLLSSLRAAPAK